MIYIDVDTAVVVPVNIMPLIDDTDFKTRETAVAYNAAGMDLVWNFVTTAGVVTQTAVTPTTGGSYDWTHVGDGMYSIEIPASGGASINNDTEGHGYFTGLATGVLPWRSETFCFRAAALNNALIDGGDNLDVNTTEISGDSSAADALETMLDGTGGNLLKATNLPTANPGANNGLPTVDGSNYIAGIQGVKNQLDDLNDLAAAGIRSAVGLASANLDTQLAAIDDFLDTEIAAIKTKTDLIPAAPAAVGDIPTADQNADALLDRTDGIETGITVRKALRGVLAACVGKLSGAATTTVTIRNAGDSKNVIVATVDADGNRSAVTLDLT